MSCKQCSGPVSEKRRRYHAKFCSRACGTLFERGLWASANPRGQPANTHHTGALNELRVAVDLMQRGYDVFRALSPGCPCDLAILKDHKILRLEVTCAYESGRTGKLTHPKKDPMRYDVLAMVHTTGITYIPETF